MRAHSLWILFDQRLIGDAPAIWRPCRRMMRSLEFAELAESRSVGVDLEQTHIEALAVHGEEGNALSVGGKSEFPREVLGYFSWSSSEHRDDEQLRVGHSL